VILNIYFSQSRDPAQVSSGLNPGTENLHFRQIFVEIAQNLSIIAKITQVLA
jgi:hypothetical protein